MIHKASGTPTRSGAAAAAIFAVGALLAVGFVPLLLDRFWFYDDEGFFVVAARALDSGGLLYVDVSSAYGPFYHSLIGLIYRLSGVEPTLTSGRIIVLGFTTLSAGIFAAAVWRVTRGVSVSVIAEVATFIVLIRRAGDEPLHPGSLIVLLLAVLVYALASYSIEQRGRLLVVAGGAVGALLMTKVNVGVFAVAAIVIAWAVGNPSYSRWLRHTVLAAVLLLPFVLMFKSLDEAGWMLLAATVSASVLATSATLSADPVPLPRFGLAPAAAGAAIVIGASMVWPLVRGTTPTELFTGIFIRPLEQVDNLSVMIARPGFNWVGGAIALAAALAVLDRRREAEAAGANARLLASAGLAVLALWIVGQATNPTFGLWLPAIAAVPALAWIAEVPPAVRLALRLLVPLAILQALHAYPVASTQAGWATAAMVVPSAIGVGAGLERLRTWTGAPTALRALSVSAVCILLVAAAGLWPVAAWSHYQQLEPVNLPGTEMIRISPQQIRTLQQLTSAVKENCDTFYSAPGFNSLYVFSELPPPTGLLRHWPGVLSTDEQRTIAAQLAAAASEGKRVCIVRDDTRQEEWSKSGYGAGPLGEALAPYQRRVATVKRFSVSVIGPAGADSSTS